MNTKEFYEKQFNGTTTSKERIEWHKKSCVYRKLYADPIAQALKESNKFIPNTDIQVVHPKYPIPEIVKEYYEFNKKTAKQVCSLCGFNLEGCLAPPRFIHFLEHTYPELLKEEMEKVVIE
jgi:hypothetical protein